ncbi:galactose-1-phosphate uridylyltransferase [Haloglycomyces albus]|uniref:galactose-1-phosphate uridylyltransferase n=1 Tax=Haloglycomyces albus TaxID=526067 RepID=UPI00046D3970|nr:galactose-1-phosphate uridylyltransferase [Haloglycomyces albus]
MPDLQEETATLFDGRILRYFDVVNSGRAAATDQRRADSGPAQGQQRWDPLRQEWVTVSAARNGRPLLPVDCPLCPTTTGNPTEIPAQDYYIAVFDNRFPSFTGTPTRSDQSAELGAERPANGHCEVVCFSADHASAYHQLDTKRIADILSVQAQRTAELFERPDVREVTCFENRGVDIGVTLHHPHGQIYAYPDVTPTTALQYTNALRHRRDTGKDLFQEILDFEVRAGERIIAETDHWVAFVPHSARWPCEIHIYPTTGLRDLTELDEPRIHGFAPLVKSILAAMTTDLSDDVPYMTAWRQAPRTADGRFDGVGRLRFEIVSPRRSAGKLKYLASSEALMGAFVNDVAPESLAEHLRTHLNTRESA